MKKLFAAIALLALAACDDVSKRVSKPTSVSVSSVDYPGHFEGAWVMSSGWSGHMGVAIALSKDRYYYWMYSDIPVEVVYPYTGTFRIQGDQLLLNAPFASANGEPAGLGLYSDRWKILRSGVSLRLHAITDKENDHARSLIPDFQFDPKNPFRNQSNLNPEQDAAPDR